MTTKTLPRDSGVSAGTIRCNRQASGQWTARMKGNPVVSSAATPRAAAQGLLLDTLRFLARRIEAQSLRGTDIGDLQREVEGLQQRLQELGASVEVTRRPDRRPGDFPRKREITVMQRFVGSRTGQTARRSERSGKSTGGRTTSGEIRCMVCLDLAPAGYRGLANWVCDKCLYRDWSPSRIPIAEIARDIAGLLARAGPDALRSLA